MTRKSIYGVEIPPPKQKMKLTDDDVRKIRRSRASDRMLAKRFGVDHSTVNAIRNRKMRRSVP